MKKVKKNSPIRTGSYRSAPEFFDVIIIGTGIAGVFTALNIIKNLKILMITKETMDRSTSHLAQGGITSPIFGPDLYEDTLRAGGYINDPNRVRILVEEGPGQIEKLIQWGVPFDRDSKGELSATGEGGHSQRNILHCKDETGKKIMTTLEGELRKREGVTLLEETYVYKLTAFGKGKREPHIHRKNWEAKTGGIVSVILPDGEEREFHSPNIVIATGGIGGLYEVTSNPEGNTGDGMALGEALGIPLKNMEFNQFHPTYFHCKEGSGFLVTEALRGEGAVLRNGKGETFMKEKHPMGDLAPRDVVVRGIFEELQKSVSENVTLDISHKEKTFIKTRFPKIYRKALKKGYDITKEALPVAPASHYMMGGMEVDDYGESGIPGIYAVGECACSEVHGANRLASNSLLDAIVFAGRVGAKISEGYHERVEDLSEQKIYSNLNICRNQKNNQELPLGIKDLEAYEKMLKKKTQRVLGILKKAQQLQRFLSDLNRISGIFHQKEAPTPWTAKDKRAFYEMKSRLTITRYMAEATLKRKKNIGTHYKIIENK